MSIPLVLIPKFRKGNKVKTKLSNGQSVGEREVGSYLKIKDDGWYHVEEDGNLTKVDTLTVQRVKNNNARGTHGVDSNHWSNLLVNGVSKLAKISNPLSPVVDYVKSKTDASKDLNNTLLRNTFGIGDWSDIVGIITGPFTNNYYDGKIHKSEINDYGYNYISEGYNDNRNLVNLYTHHNEKGFLPSKIGQGIYSNHPEYSKLPAYEGNFYNTDTLYLNSGVKPFFDNNLNKRFNHDHDKLVIGMLNIEGTDDVRNYQMTPKLIDGKYYVDMEDVWNLDKFGMDSRNYPFILNQRLPVVFTLDSLKYNQIPKLSEWFAKESVK